MSRTLVTLLGGAAAGIAEQSTRGDLSFRYERTWQDSALSYPLSLSMSLVESEHGDAQIRSFMEGLLPDNEAVLQLWARRFGASPRNPFSLLNHVGEDVAGAVQFVTPKRVEELAVASPEISWLTERKVANRLRQLIADNTSWHDVVDAGYFSLAGAQPKTALLYDGKRWGVPSGRIATTHIFKPPALDYPALAENEHLCLNVAREIGLPAARSHVMRFENQVALVAERYDRIPGGEIVRVHQEDFCQALAVSPSIKYEAEGGPGVAAMAAVIRSYSSAPTEDLRTFIRSIAFHWGMGAPDAHAKNYSVLIAPGGQVRLAPLYDIITVLPYRQRFYLNKIRLAMRVGGEYRMRYIRPRHWLRLADECGLAGEFVLKDIAEVLNALPAAVAECCARGRDDGFDKSFLKLFEESITKHAAWCYKVLQTSSV